ncbi:Low molecular weight protein-tyrosine-phosphatase YfkJ [Acaryochloris thomasi RCC1774]|uniref:protein-tyrosine-phosphatase n=1 Tax=Acaryochloris thomasi RCC1774 TaxID=1764569 RepID=A0A2W1JJF6_9CYAN|nr:low molecular weight protein-tyrosine-phosphatase [Acaryochloris thomasi]PZD73613.1 Low molecular weight protein-tyrosine-phosphatase YfkJ [Acaryochloris thomasi RCC1774]
MPQKLLFVCLGNICRSPSAEGIMNHLIAEAGLSQEIICDSAGTSGFHIGEPADRRMSAAAQQQGFTLTSRSRKFEVSDFEEFDLILAMDQDNYDAMLALDRTGRYHHKLKMICEFCQNHSDHDVPDPYYGGPSGFTYVIDLLADACAGLLHYLTQEQRA